MKDYISREAANEACREAVRRYPNSFYNGIEAARDAIRKLPAADVRPKWISTDERLPEEEGYYLTIGPYGAFRVCYYGPSLKHRGYQVFLDQNKKKINAIAWMKIPRYETKEEK